MIRKFIFPLLIVFIFGFNIKQEIKPSTVLKGATIFIGNGKVIEEGVIIINGGKITLIGGKETPIPENAELIDVKGKFITPGLVDSHIHFSQTGFFDSRPDVLDIRDSIDYVEMQSFLKNNPGSYYEAYLRSGVTAVYDAGGFLWTIERQISAEDDPNAPHIAAAGPLLTGVPDEELALFNMKDEKQILNLSSQKFAREVVQKHSSLGTTGITIWGVPLLDKTFSKRFQAVADETKIHGSYLIADCFDIEETKEAMRLGAKILVHGVSDTEVDDEFIQIAKASDIIYSPTMTVLRGYLNAFKSLKEMREINDPNNVIDERAKNFIETSTDYLPFYFPQDNFDEGMIGLEKTVFEKEQIMSSNLKKVYDAGITITVATDAGNPGTFHGISIYDEMEVMQRAGIPAGDIIVMATKNGAMAMQRLDDFGTLENGKMADLIILTNNPSIDISNMRSITHVMRGGLLRPVNKPFEKVSDEN